MDGVIITLLSGKCNRKFSAGPLRAAGVGSALICQAQEIIYAGLVEFGQFDENISGDIHISALIVAVNALTAAEHLGDRSMSSRRLRIRSYAMLSPQKKHTAVNVLYLNFSEFFAKIRLR